MKILFITNARYVNYTELCLFHGLISLGHNVTDSTYIRCMSVMQDEYKYNLYGKGFTIFGLLPDRSNIDRSNIIQRIIKHEFDYVIYGNGTIRGNNVDYIDIVLKYYNKNEIAICDGGDEQLIETNFINKVTYFKRELVQTNLNIFPISYAFPEEKIIKNNPIKKKIIASIIPGKLSTYIYDNEIDYYKDYQESKFAITKKKCGWDCLRHYEILANKCIPRFEDINKCPIMTLTNYPKSLQILANNMFLTQNFSNYDLLLNEFFNYFKTHMTTKHLAQYVLSIIKNNK